MSYKEIRPMPVPAFVAMRSTLVALAHMKAQLQAYNEETGVIVATLSEKLGLKKRDVIVRVRPYQETAQVEIEAPDQKQADQLWQLIGNYVTDGAKVEANTRIQWIDLQRQAEAKAKRREWTNKAKSLLPGQRSTPTAEPAPTAPENEDGETVIGEAGTALIPIPDNPGVLVKNEQDKVIELKIDPQVFIDRTDHLITCQACASTVMRGSLYCSHCGRPLTLEAIQPELQGGVEKTAAQSLQYALGGLAFNMVPLLLLIVPALFRSSDISFITRVSEWVSAPLIVGVFLLGIAPMVFLGWRAMSHAQRASWYYNLSGTPNYAKRTRGLLGNALGWACIYLAIAWTLFIVIALF